MAFFFAWCGQGETFGPEHKVFDEDVLAFRISHEEGDFARLSVEIRNPRIGLLAPGRDLWAFLAVEDDSTDGAAPLFYGRLVGIPEDMQDEVVSLVFVARPHDWDEQRRDLAATLKVAPFWDPVWIVADRRDDPDSVLEARTQLWHIDRVTHLVTVSDIITGEDATVDFPTVFYDGTATGLGQTPLRRVTVEATIQFDQTAIGSVDLSQSLIAAFATAGTTRQGAITSYTGEGLMRDWPEKGDKIGGGWSVGTSEIVRTDGKAWTQDYEQIILSDTSVAQFPLWTMRPTFFVDYEVSRPRVERVTFTLETDVQAILTDPGDEDSLLITLSTADVGLPVDPADTDDPAGTIPLGDARRKAYLPTDRGQESLQYLIALARAHLLARARAVEVSFAVPFEDAVGLSLRMNGHIEDGRLPGGEATGKIIAYELSCDGDTGEMSAGVTIGCTIGKGNTVTEAAGTPDYVEAGYVEDSYQTFTGKLIMPIAGEVTYADFSSTAITDDGLDLFNMTPGHVVSSLTVINGQATQKTVLNEFFPDLSAAVEAVNQVYTEVDLELRRLKIDADEHGRAFETSFEIEVSDLMCPKTLDLEADGGTA